MPPDLRHTERELKTYASRVRGGVAAAEKRRIDKLGWPVPDTDIATALRGRTYGLPRRTEEA